MRDNTLDSAEIRWEILKSMLDNFPQLLDRTERYILDKRSLAQKSSVDRSIEMKDTIIGLVKGINPQAIEAEAETRLSRNLNEEILEELRRIRKAVERT